jgi:hypothetical protein
MRIGLDTLMINLKRRLALEVRSKRFGFAVFEGERLLDWGASRCSHFEIAARKVSALVLRYAPSVALARRIRRTANNLQDSTPDVMRSIRRALKRQAVTFVILQNRRLRGFFRANGCRNKHQIAMRLALEFPMLKRMVPKTRKAWDPEPHTTIVFDAIATDLAYRESS